MALLTLYLLHAFLIHISFHYLFREHIWCLMKRGAGAAGGWHCSAISILFVRNVIIPGIPFLDSTRNIAPPQCFSSAHPGEATRFDVESHCCGTNVLGRKWVCTTAAAAAATVWNWKRLRICAGWRSCLHHVLFTWFDSGTNFFWLLCRATLYLPKGWCPKTVQTNCTRRHFWVVIFLAHTLTHSHTSCRPVSKIKKNNNTANPFFPPQNSYVHYIHELWQNIDTARGMPVQLIVRFVAKGFKQNPFRGRSTASETMKKQKKKKCYK